MANPSFSCATLDSQALAPYGWIKPRFMTIFRFDELNFFWFSVINLFWIHFRPILNPNPYSASKTASTDGFKSIFRHFRQFALFRPISHYSALFCTIPHYFGSEKKWFFDVLTSRKYGVNDPSGISHFCLSSKWHFFIISYQLLAKNCFRQINILF